MATCGDCDTVLSAGNKSGYCRRHVSQHFGPDHAKRISEGLKRKLRSDPQAMEIARRNARKAGKLPQAVAARKRMAKVINLSQIGRNAMTEESRRKAGRSIARKRLPWCPPEYIDEYRRLRRSCKLSVDEAKAAVLEQHERDLERLRQRMTR